MSFFTPRQSVVQCKQAFGQDAGSQRNPVVANLDESLRRNPLRHHRSSKTLTLEVQSNKVRLQRAGRRYDVGRLVLVSDGKRRWAVSNWLPYRLRHERSSNMLTLEIVPKVVKLAAAACYAVRACGCRLDAVETGLFLASAEVS